MAALLSLPACRPQTPGQIDLTIIADGAIGDAALGTIVGLEVVISGAASADRSYPVDQPFAGGRQQRIVIKPPVSSGSVAIDVVAREGRSATVAEGQTTVVLRATGAVAATLVLVSSAAAVGDMGTPLDAEVGPDLAARGPVLALVAGRIGGMGYADGVGAGARFNNPRGILYEAGNLYIADTRNHVLRKLVVATGVVSTLAGRAMGAGSVDGIGPAARFNRPHGLCSDGTGNLYLTDQVNALVRKYVIATGAVTTIAGSAGQTGNTDGVGSAARFDRPHGIACDRAGNLFVADAHAHTIRQLVIATGAVSTLAGTAYQASFADGTGASARFSSPHDLVFDNGNLYVADNHNRVIRQIVAGSGVVTTLAGAGGQLGFADGTGGNARLGGPRGLVADGNGNLFFSDTDNQRVRKVVESSGVVTTLAGLNFGSNDGAGAGASFESPVALAYDGGGNLYGLDAFGHTVRKIVIASATVTTVAGIAGAEGSSDGAGAAATFRRPHALWVDGTTLYVADKQNHSIRKIDLPTGDVATLAGTGQPGSADGTGAAASFNSPFGVVSNGAGKLYVSDAGNHTLRMIDLASGAVTTLAGAAGQAAGTDGPVATARFNNPAGLAYASGMLYVGDFKNHTIRQVDLTALTVSTLAGSAGQRGSADGVGSAARFSNPNGVVRLGSTLYIADQGNNTIRALALANNTVTTVAGSVGQRGFADGVGTAALFSVPHALASDGSGTLYVADTTGHTVRKLAVATGAVTTWVGQGNVGAVQFGALPARLNTPGGLAFGSDGALYIATTHENAIVVVK